MYGEWIQIVTWAHARKGIYTVEIISSIDIPSKYYQKRILLLDAEDGLTTFNFLLKMFFSKDIPPQKGSDEYGKVECAWSLVEPMTKEESSINTQ